VLGVEVGELAAQLLGVGAPAVAHGLGCGELGVEAPSQAIEVGCGPAAAYPRRGLGLMSSCPDVSRPIQYSAISHRATSTMCGSLGGHPGGSAVKRKGHRRPGGPRF
jgi:hypothetical protein